MLSIQSPSFGLKKNLTPSSRGKVIPKRKGHILNAIIMMNTGVVNNHNDNIMEKKTWLAGSYLFNWLFFVLKLGICWRMDSYHPFEDGMFHEIMKSSIQRSRGTPNHPFQIGIFHEINYSNPTINPIITYNNHYNPLIGGSIINHPVIEVPPNLWNPSIGFFGPSHGPAMASRTPAASTAAVVPRSSCDRHAGDRRAKRCVEMNGS